MNKYERCPECDEVRLDESGEIDARVQAGMKCGVCSYGQDGEDGSKSVTT